METACIVRITQLASGWKSLEKEDIIHGDASNATYPASCPALAARAVHDKLNKGPHKLDVLVLGVLLAIGFAYTLWNRLTDIRGVHPAGSFTFLLLGVALLVALGFRIRERFS